MLRQAAQRSRGGASHAKVHFGEFTDADVERYIATGEPLEVAGSFTLEGFGGAFIDSIEGDPHGIIGLSLPLARHLAGELGITWTDLWNVGRGELEPESKASGNQHAGILPPVENVHQPGDGWVDCACGRKHWGTNGASGILLARRDPVSGKVTHVVMQHRAAWSAEGGTWGIPENPSRTVEPKANDDESMEICWVPIDDVPNRKLLTAMKTDWPRFAARLDELATAQ